MIVMLAVIAGLAAVLLFGFRARDDRDVEPGWLGKQAAVIEMPLFARYQEEYGPVFDAADYWGRPMVINFWASWCIPACYNEAPILEAAWRAHREHVQFVGVDTQDRDADAEEFLDQFQLSFPNGKDPNARVALSYGLLGVPETFFLREDGTLAYRHVGEINAEQLEQQIQALMTP
jgi:cytochrome c biogenesis protein CcmG/thiol:disulfide interchange protein DsbE